MENKGFSLVELLVVVIIIAVIAAIAIPSLLASRRAANEASAIASIRNVHSAQTAYFSTFGANQNFADLSDLGTTRLLDPLMGGNNTVDKSGYRFTITLPGSSPFDRYCATALSIEFGTTGSRDFGVNNAGVIYASPTDGDISCSNGTLNAGSGSPIE